MLKVIPAIDIKNNYVVRASQSNRENYKPIKSMLVKGSKPVDIVSALLKTYAFNTVYIADLDSISRTFTFSKVFEKANETNNINLIKCNIFL